MMKFNLVGDYEGPYRISVIEWVLVLLNVAVLVAGVIVWLQ
jgi:hypothetical protein